MTAGGIFIEKTLSKNKNCIETMAIFVFRNKELFEEEFLKFPLTSFFSKLATAFTRVLISSSDTTQFFKVFCSFFKIENID